MRTFRCDHCGNVLHFENVSCLQCGSSLAFLPGAMDLCAVEPAPGQDGLVRRRAGAPEGADAARELWRLCANHGDVQACNFAIPAHDPQPLCVSCRQTRVLPDLSVPQNRLRWYRIEVAKRRLFFTLARLRLVDTDPPGGLAQGPTYEFLADEPDRQVITGHADGVITLNVAEADDDERTRRRLAMHEPYRTLLGHLRHESGHYYWDELIERPGRQEAFRAVFGDERAPYQEALRQHYASGGQPAGWQQGFVSAYATAHPWEDWAETWAHYLHMVDLLETAADYRTRLHVPGQGREAVADPFARALGFDALVAQWVPLTLLVNSLNRSLGHEDAYPFALSATALGKLRYVHELIASVRGAPGASPSMKKA